MPSKHNSDGGYPRLPYDIRKACQLCIALTTDVYLMDGLEVCASCYSLEDFD